MEQRGTRRTLTGVVSSDKMDKTITVVVTRRFKHSKYKKYVQRRKKYHAHDEENAAREGDQVQLVASRPYSKLKRWRLLRIVEQAEYLAPTRAEAAPQDSLVESGSGGEA